MNLDQCKPIVKKILKNQYTSYTLDEEIRALTSRSLWTNYYTQLNFSWDNAISFRYLASWSIMSSMNSLLICSSYPFLSSLFKLCLCKQHVVTNLILILTWSDPTLALALALTLILNPNWNPNPSYCSRRQTRKQSAIVNSPWGKWSKNICGVSKYQNHVSHILNDTKPVIWIGGVLSVL